MQTQIRTKGSHYNGNMQSKQKFRRSYKEMRRFMAYQENFESWGALEK